MYPKRQLWHLFYTELYCAHAWYSLTALCNIESPLLLFTFALNMQRFLQIWNTSCSCECKKPHFSLWPNSEFLLPAPIWQGKLNTGAWVRKQLWKVFESRKSSRVQVKSFRGYFFLCLSGFSSVCWGTIILAHPNCAKTQNLKPVCKM